MQMPKKIDEKMKLLCEFREKCKNDTAIEVFKGFTIADAGELIGVMSEPVNGNLQINEQTIPAINPSEIGALLLVDCKFPGLLLARSKINRFMTIGSKEYTLIKKCIKCLKKDLPPPGKKTLIEIVQNAANQAGKNLFDGVCAEHSGFFKNDHGKQSIGVDVNIDEFGKAEKISGSAASGLCMDDAVVDGCAIFINTDIDSMMARNLKIEGDLIFDSCLIDGGVLFNYNINKNGTLQLIEKRNENFEVKNFTMVTSHKPKGKLKIEGITFQNTIFSLPGEKFFFSPTLLNGVIFVDCDFAGAEIEPRPEPDDFNWDWFFSGCKLTDTFFRNLKGKLTIEGGEIDCSFQDCEFEPEIKNHKIELCCNNTIFKNPAVDGVTFNAKTKAPWINFQIIVESNCTGNLSNCVFNNIDLSDKNSKIAAQGMLDLSGSRFFNCNLKGVNFANCNLEETIFTDCDLSDCEFPDSVVINKLTISGQAAKLNGIRLSGKKIAHFTLSNVSSEQAGLIICDDAEFIQSKFSKLSFEGWNANNATFKGCEFDHCSFNKCKIDGVKFENKNEHVCVMSNVDMRNQEVIRGVHFDAIKVKASCNFSGITFALCNINTDGLFKEHPDLSGTTWDSSIFKALLSLETFPFAQVKMIKNVSFDRNELINVHIDCELKDIEFNLCKHRKTSFGGIKRNCKITNMKVSLDYDNIDTLIFSHCIINSLSITSNSSNVVGLIRFEHNQIKCLEVKDLDVSDFIITEQNDKIAKLVINNCKFDNFNIADCEISSGNFTFESQPHENSFTSQNREISNVTFSDKVLFMAINLNNARIDNCNLLELPSTCFSGLSIKNSEINKLKISTELSQEIEIVECSFTECDFSDALMSGIKLSGCRFDIKCDLTKLRDNQAENVDFTATEICGKIDGLTFNNCNFDSAKIAGTSHGNKREIKNVFFDHCRFNDQTKIENLIFTAVDGKSMPFSNSDTLCRLKFDNVVIRNCNLANLTFAANHNLTLENCLIEDVIFRDCRLKLQLTNCETSTITFNNVVFNNNDLVFENDCQIEQIIFFNCKILGMEVDDTAFKRVYFNQCNQLLNINFLQCSFMEKVSFAFVDDFSSSESEINVQFCSCYFPQKPLNAKKDDKGQWTPVFEFVGNIGQTKIKKFEIDYFSEEMFSKTTRHLLGNYDIGPGRHIGKEWTHHLPFCDRVAEIKVLVETGDIGGARHKDIAVSDNQKFMHQAYKKFRDRLSPEKELFSEETREHLLEITAELIKITKQDSPNLKTYLETKNKWESLMLLRLNVDKELEDLNDFHGFIDSLAHKGKVKLEYPLAWPHGQNGKIYMDFGMFSDLISSRILSNIERYAENKSVRIVALIDENGEDKILQLAIGDNGPGFDLHKLEKGSEFGNILKNFSGCYTKGIIVRSMNNGGEQIMESSGYRFNHLPINQASNIKFQEWFGRGTVYVFKLPLY